MLLCFLENLCEVVAASLDIFRFIHVSVCFCICRMTVQAAETNLLVVLQVVVI